MGLLFSLLLLVGGTAGAQVYPPQVAGAFYPADPGELKAAVDRYLAQVSTAALPGTLVAALVPHAGYEYSAPIAAQAYALLKSRPFSTVILLGTGHHFAVPGAATLEKGSLRTPLGEVPIDDEAVARLRKLSPLVEVLPAAFREEHSIEVQLPFLQRLWAPRSFRVVPLLMNTEDPETCRRIGLALAQLLKPGKALLLVSSDLSHYPDRATARAVDTVSLAALAAAGDDPDYFWRTNRLLMKRGGTSLVCTECGEAGVLAAQHAMKVLGARLSVLAYANSGELAGGDGTRSVGYAAAAWTTGGPSAPPAPLSPSHRAALLKLARSALADKLGKGAEPGPALWAEPAFGLPAAVFVTLRRAGLPKETSLRGCIGSLVPDLPLAEAVQAYAIKSALEDSRFPPVKAEELKGLTIEISKLSPFRKAKNAAAVRQGQGVLLRQGGASGIFLPQVWEQLPDKTQFLEELCEQKAGLPRDCWKDPRTELQVFDAEAFEE